MTNKNNFKNLNSQSSNIFSLKLNTILFYQLFYITYLSIYNK